MKLPNEIVSILEEGEYLSELGINEWAHNKSNSLRLLELLEKNNAPVYGGDVFVRSQNKIESTHDNWFCEREKNESYDFYIKRSVSIARAYILEYRSKPSGEKLFTIAFGFHG